MPSKIPLQDPAVLGAVEERPPGLQLSNTVGGFPGVQLVNLGQVRNQGFELSLDTRLLDQRSLGWELGVSFSTNDSRIVSLGGLPPIALNQAGAARSLNQYHIEGYPVGAFFLVVSGLSAVKLGDVVEHEAPALSVAQHPSLPAHSLGN